MPKDRENELVQFILQYMLEHQFENKSDMARQLWPCEILSVNVGFP